MAVQRPDNPGHRNAGARRAAGGSGASRAGGFSGVPVLVPVGGHTGKPPIVLNRPVFIIGSHNRARIHLNSTSVSRHHALLAQTRHQTYIRDLASRTHVFVNGVQVREHVLADGDHMANADTKNFSIGTGAHVLKPKLGLYRTNVADAAAAM